MNEVFISYTLPAFWLSAMAYGCLWLDTHTLLTGTALLCNALFVIIIKEVTRIDYVGTMCEPGHAFPCIYTSCATMAVVYYGWQFYTRASHIWSTLALVTRLCLLVAYLLVLIWSRIGSQCATLLGVLVGAFIGGLTAVLYTWLKSTKYEIKLE